MHKWSFIITFLLSLFCFQNETMSMGSSGGGGSYSPPPPSTEELEHRRKMQLERMEHEKIMQQQKFNHDEKMQNERLEARKIEILSYLISGLIFSFLFVVTIFLILKKIRDTKMLIQQNEHNHNLKIKVLNVVQDPNVLPADKTKLISILDKEYQGTKQISQINKLEYIDVQANDIHRDSVDDYVVSKKFKKVNNTYNVFFKGEIQNDVDINQVKKNFIKHFHINDSKIPHLFSGKKIKVKKNISIDVANKYLKKFERLGAVAIVEDNQ